jgi:hypothetical protein
MVYMSDGAVSSGLPLGILFAVVNLAWALGNMAGTAGSGLVAAASDDGVATRAAALMALPVLGAVVVAHARHVRRRRADDEPRRTRKRAG